MEIGTSAFFEYLSCNALSLSLKPDGTLSLNGPMKNRTEAIRRYIRINREPLLSHLQQKAAIETLIKETLADAIAGRLPETLPDAEALDLMDGVRTTTPRYSFAMAWADAQSFDKSNPTGWQKTQGGKRLIHTMTTIARWWEKRKEAL